MKNRKIIITLITFCALFSPLAAQDNDVLMEAYQREFIYLDNEIRLLEERIEEVKKSGEARLDEARLELNILETTYLESQDQISRKTDELRMLEDEEGSSGSSYDTVITVITQAESRLARYGRPTFKESMGEAYAHLDDQEKIRRELRYVFEESLSLLEELGTVRVEKGAFFLPSGKQVEGELVKIGQIAAFGSAGDKGGTLAPAGGGRFHLVREENKDVADEMLRGNQPELLPVFLFESLENLIENRKGKTIMDTIEGGGVIGLVIIGLGIIALTLIIIRAITLWRVNPDNQDEIIDELAKLVEAKDISRAKTEAKSMTGALGRVVEATLNGLLLEPAKVEDTISESVLNEQPAVNRYRIAISVFAAVAPLLGLLGTVTGMIATFDIITLYGTGDPKLLSGGISEALVTTELGLIVAIPTLLIGNLLSSWADRINSEMEVSALRMVNATSGFKSSKKKKKEKKKPKETKER